MRIRYVGPIGGEMIVVDRRAKREYETVNRVVDIPDALATSYLAQDVWEAATPVAPEPTQEDGD